MTDATCISCGTAIASGCTAVTCNTNRFDTNGIVIDGCEAGCAAVTDGTCTACDSALASGCTAVTCNINKFDTNGNAVDGCEAGCSAVADGTCTACDSALASGCTAVTCATNSFDTNNDATDGCEIGTHLCTALTCDVAGTKKSVGAGSATMTVYAGLSLSSSSFQWTMSNQISKRQGSSPTVASDQLGRIYIAYQDIYYDDTAYPPALQKVTVKRLSSFSFAPETTGVATSTTTGNAGGAAVQKWQTLGTEGKQGQHASPNKGDTPVIVFDSSNRPLVLYREACNLPYEGDSTAANQCPDGVISSSLSLSRYDAQSNQWTQAGPRGFTESGGYSASVRHDGFTAAVTSDNKVYVAYLVRHPDDVDESDIASWLRVATWNPKERIAPSFWSHDETWQSATMFPPHKVGLTAHDNLTPRCPRHSRCTEIMYDHRWSSTLQSWRDGCTQMTGSARPNCATNCHYCCKEWGSLRCKQEVLPDDVRRKWRHLPSPVDDPQWNMLSPGSTVVVGKPSFSTFENIPVLCFFVASSATHKYNAKYHCKKFVEGKWQGVTETGGRGATGWNVMYRAFDTVMHPTQFKIYVVWALGGDNNAPNENGISNFQVDRYNGTTWSTLTFDPTSIDMTTMNAKIAEGANSGLLAWKVRTALAYGSNAVQIELTPDGLPIVCYNHQERSDRIMESHRQNKNDCALVQQDGKFLTISTHGISDGRANGRNFVAVSPTTGKIYAGK